MIKIEVYKNKDNKLVNQFIISGHADYNEKGKDILCSAVSTVTDFMILYLKNANIKHLYNFDVVEPYKSIYVRKNYEPLVEALFVTTLDFFKLLAKQYPQHIELMEQL